MLCPSIDSADTSVRMFLPKPTIVPSTSIRAVLPSFGALNFSTSIYVFSRARARLSLIAHHATKLNAMQESLTGEEAGFSQETLTKTFLST